MEEKEKNGVEFCSVLESISFLKNIDLLNPTYGLQDQRSHSMIITIAVIISCKSEIDKYPSLRINLCRATLLNCNTSADDSLVNPLSEVGVK
jgi:hypothetical protein